MHHYDLEILEFNKVINMLTAEAETLRGKDFCTLAAPAKSLEKSEKFLAETDDALCFLERYGRLSFGGMSDITGIVKLAELGSVLGIKDLLSVESFLNGVKRLKECIPHTLIAADGTDIINALRDPQKLEAYQTGTDGAAKQFPLETLKRLSWLDPVPHLLRRLETCIAGEDELFDQASPELFSLRNKIKANQNAVRATLEKIMRSDNAGLQEEFVTMRQGRFVIPVRSDAKGKVQGIVHDTSQSGLTLFIEPLAVVELNNKITELEIKEKAEIERILQELTAIVKEHTAVLAQDQKLVTRLDFAQAKARLSLKLKAVRPHLNASGVICLRKARHPLLAPDKVVPVDFAIGDTYSTLVITGPNTGGKTVTLKTCGLLTLMALTGLHVPTAANPEIAFFTNVLADIGTEQSIEQNLSTFSAHIRHLVEILQAADANSLVLLDELCSGTDPSEGAALAIAILQYLKKQNICTVATTHYPQIKSYALNEQGVENASCEFDLETLSPTYRLLIGVPGVSHAFAIARKLSLPEAIVSHAETLISKEETDFAALVASLEKGRREYEAHQDELAKLQQDFLKKEREFAASSEKASQQADKIIAAAEAEAAQIVAEARTEAADLISLIKQKSSSTLAHNDVSDIKNAERNLLQKRSYRHKKPLTAADKPLQIADIVIGDTYAAPSYGFTGKAKAVDYEKSDVLLENGAIKVNVNVSLLQKAVLPRKTSHETKGYMPSATQKLTSAKHLTATYEIMLLGMYVDEALVALDKFIDDAMLGGVDTIRIIHGKGTGVLRSAVHEFLSRDSRIDSFALGGENEGGNGVTFANLKK